MVRRGSALRGGDWPWVLAIVGDSSEGRVLRVFYFSGFSGLRKKRMRRSQMLMRERKTVRGARPRMRGKKEIKQKKIQLPLSWEERKKNPTTGKKQLG